MLCLCRDQYLIFFYGKNQSGYLRQSLEGINLAIYEKALLLLERNHGDLEYSIYRIDAFLQTSVHLSKLLKLPDTKVEHKGLALL